jgi:signal transduction histidine kinase
MTTRNGTCDRPMAAALPEGMGGAYGDEKYNQLQQALEAADIGLWDWDLDSDRVVMSDNTKKLLDIDAAGADIPFEMFLSSIHPADREHISVSLQNAIRQKSSFDEEFRTEKRDQTIHWMRIRGRVSAGDAEVRERVMGSIHDKTGRKMAYDALENARSELEEKVKERTRELLDSNERLRQEISIKNRLQKQIMEISEKEHRRIGQDLHDSLSQQLGGILFMGQVLFEKLKTAAPDEAREMKKVIIHLQNALTHTRDLAKGLYPTLAEGGIGAALNELAVSVSELYAVKIEVTCEKGVNASDEATTIHVYRIVQEALNNAIKHGQATRVDIHLFRRTGAIVLMVSDNGTGFPEKPNKKGMGLNIMKYRASSIGSSFEIVSRRNRGTVVRCVFDKSSALVR